VGHLIKHDLSKFDPSEFIPYMNHFYGSPPIHSRGRNSPTFPAFQQAFQLHWSRNPHHWEYWANLGTDIDPKPIPDVFRREMLADWNGTGRSKKGIVDTPEWYQRNKHTMVLHKDTRNWIERQLGFSLEFSEFD
jgi:hypothetical protein